jgi:hypothetical protein
MTEEYYPMPMFATAVVTDLDAAADWYRAAGFRRIFTQATRSRRACGRTAAARSPARSPAVEHR